MCEVETRNRTSPIGGTPVDTACFEREMRSSAPVNPPRVRSTPFLESQTVVPSHIKLDHASDDFGRRALARPSELRNVIAVVVTVPGAETTPRARFVRVPCEVSAARRAFFREEFPSTARPAVMPRSFD